MRDIPTSPRILEIKHKRRIYKLRVSILFIILFASIIFTLSYFSNDSHLVINKIEIIGTHIIDKEEVEKEIKNNLYGKYIYLFSKSNSFIYPHDKIYNDLISKFPRIESLSISHDGLKTLNINISERTGSYLYCGSSIPEYKSQVGENCYFINNDGFIFDKAPYFSGNVYFKYYLTLKDGTVNPLGKQMLSIDQFHKIVRFVDAVTDIGFKPVYIVMGQDDTNYLYLDSSLNKNIPNIIFKNNDDWDIIQDNLSLAMKKKEFKDEINSKYDTLLYIDLRFKNKVLYKFQ